MSNHEAAERAWVQSRLDHLANRFDQARAEMAADVQRLRESWSSGYAEELEAHRGRLAAMRAEKREFIKDLTCVVDDGGAQDSQGQVGASTAGRNAPASSGPGPGQPTLADELAEAERQRAHEIASMSLAEYAARRAELGVRSPESMTRLFGETR